eukprot:CAMPEP_0181325176 /NCGR_PEP_ID=MMETSP1101-20121128/20779_1 /TAXON_ID=46948 /ORGANISM="Rhodomonas abbreviata, Strain Caron Lab Isolate" /LENGTH=134 /DNA_ID=CAMNT_0023433453 /DNA_START=18 /DNA_END=420 /DNA_ORIENTATION=+
MADVDDEDTTLGDETGGAAGGGAATSGKRFEVKKWNAVALWAWDIVVDNCAIAEITSWTFALSARRTRRQQQVKNAQSHGGNATTRFISTAFLGGSRLAKFALWTTGTGSSRSTGGERLRVRVGKTSLWRGEVW